VDRQGLAVHQCHAVARAAGHQVAVVVRTAAAHQAAAVPEVVEAAEAGVAVEEEADPAAGHQQAEVMSQTPALAAQAAALAAARAAVRQAGAEVVAVAEEVVEADCRAPQAAGRQATP
jgi:hypothetical protein